MLVWVIFLVKFLFNTNGKIFFDVKLFKYNISIADSVLMHLFIHIRVLNNCLTLNCRHSNQQTTTNIQKSKQKHRKYLLPLRNKQKTFQKTTSRVFYKFRIKIHGFQSINKLGKLTNKRSIWHEPNKIKKVIQEKLLNNMSISFSTDSLMNEQSCFNQNNSVTTTDSPSKLRKSSNLMSAGIVHEIFSAQVQSKLISRKITKKAVNWLMRVGWQKNCSLQSLWTALVLFYGYRRRKKIIKQQLQCLLLVCLQLSSKFHESMPLKMSELLFSCSQAVSRDLFMKYEQQLLELFDFQIFVSHTLQILASSQSLNEDEKWKVLFLAELYLLKDDSILFNWKKCEKLVELVKGQMEKCELQCLQIRELINEGKQTIVFKKFGSKFDVQTFSYLFQ